MSPSHHLDCWRVSVWCWWFHFFVDIKKVIGRGVYYSCVFEAPLLPNHHHHTKLHHSEREETTKAGTSTANAKKKKKKGETEKKETVK